MADVPNVPFTAIPTPSPTDTNPALHPFPALDPIKVVDLVGPPATNRQHEELKKRSNTLQTYVNQLIEVANDLDDLFLQRDGSNKWLGGDGPLDMDQTTTADDGKIVNLRTGTNPKDAVNKGQMDAAITALADAMFAIGDYKVAAYVAPPSANWLACDGSAVNRTTYAALFAKVSTTYGPGNGSTTFNLPDWRGRAPLGVGTGVLLTARMIGQSGGEETHVLTESELASHSHLAGGLPGSAGGASRDGVSPYPSTHDAVTSEAGSDAAHNNMQPWIAVGVFIKAL